MPGTGSDDLQRPGTSGSINTKIKCLLAGGDPLVRDHLQRRDPGLVMRRPQVLDPPRAAA
jgi:hypothetical protein